MASTAMPPSSTTQSHTDKLVKEGFTQQKKLMCLHTCTKLTTLKGLLFNTSSVLFHLPTKPLYSFSCHSHVLTNCWSVISFYILGEIITPGNEFCIKHRKSETDHFKLIIMMQLLSKTVLRLLYIYLNDHMNTPPAKELKKGYKTKLHNLYKRKKMLS